MTDQAVEGPELVEWIKAQVRAALPDRLSLERFAQELGVSPVRVHQVFGQYQGENFGAFSRRMRLEHACALMRAFPDWSCTRVAYEAGFSESSDFSRAFKRQYGLSPNDWDRVIPLARALKKRQGNPEPSSTLGEVGFSDAFDGERARAVVRQRPKEKVVTLRVKDAHTPDLLRKGFDELERWLSSKSQLRAGRRFMGLSFDSTLDTPEDVFHFELAYPVDGGIGSDGPFRVRDLPSSMVAVMPSRGGVPEFIAAWDALLRGFIPGSGWCEGPGPHLEVYYNDPRKFDMQFWDMDCVVRLSRDRSEDDDTE